MSQLIESTFNEVELIRMKMNMNTTGRLVLSNIVLPNPVKNPHSEKELCTSNPLKSKQ